MHLSGDTAFLNSDSRPSLLERWHLDLPLLLALLTASALGLIILYSAGREDLDLVLRQALRLGLGFLIMVGLAQIPPRYLRRWTPWIFFGGIVLLAGVLTIGEVSKGARRWLDLGLVRFQPSEIMRLAVPMMMAWYFADRPLPPSAGALCVGTLITLVPVLLIAKQPDLGTALLVGCAGVFALFLSGLSWKIIAGLGILGAAGGPLLWQFGMHDYQRQRILTFLDPQADPLGTGYHIIQSQIAIGSGGLYGKGWLNSTQAHLDFLPESSTDFILAVFAEEFGLMGLCALLALYFFIIARCLYMATQAPTSYERLLGGSLALTFFVYLFVNAGMVCGLLPVVGLPLPLISYGGSSLVTIMAGFGILMGVYSQRRSASY
jgi:rod shape determining protein RodA